MANGRCAGLANIARSDTSVSAADINNSPDAGPAAPRAWLNPLLDHHLVVILNSADQIVYSQTRPPSQVRTGCRRPSRRCIPSFSSLRGRHADVARRGDPPGRRQFPMDQRRSTERCSCRTSTGAWGGDRRICQSRHWRPSQRQTQPPLVLTVRLFARDVIADIGQRLQLANLRMVDRRPCPRGGQPPGACRQPSSPDRAVRLDAATAGRRNPGTPSSRSSASRSPALRCSAGLVLRYMRNTAATIAAGENAAALSGAARSAMRTAEPQLLQRAAGKRDRRR